MDQRDLVQKSQGWRLSYDIEVKKDMVSLREESDGGITNKKGELVTRLLNFRNRLHYASEKAALTG